MEKSVHRGIKRKPIGRPVSEESDSDPEFRKGPIQEEEKKKVKKAKSGKTKKEVKPANEARHPRKKQKTRQWNENALRNPLIELLGVEHDEYFQAWNSEDDMKEAEDDEVDENDRDAVIWANTLAATTISPDHKELVKAHTSAEEDEITASSATDDSEGEPLDYAKIIRDMKVARKKEVESVTETDSKTEDSDTETDSDERELGSKPQLGLTSPPPRRGPYVLDSANGINVPASINRYLRDYQRDGVKFLYNRYSKRGGGILGDDMGLGKTIQVISFLNAIMKKHANAQDERRRAIRVDNMHEDGFRLPQHINDGTKRPFPPANQTWPTCLLVAPVSLIANWESELESWGYFETAVLRSGGGSEQRTNILRGFRKGRYDIVLTSFPLLTQIYEYLSDLDFSVIIVDEAHRLKSNKSKITYALSQFKCKIRFGLTGTAIQNDYEELWTLLNWSNPANVGSMKQWKRSISEPIKQGMSTKATQEEQDRGTRVAKALSEKLLPHFFLRRTKKLLENQLPKKHDLVAFCPLAPRQKMVYENFLETEEMQDMLHKDDECECGSGDRRGTCCHKLDPRTMLQYINAFLKIANSLVLIESHNDDSEEVKALNSRLRSIAYPDSNITREFKPVETNPHEYCGKWTVLKGLLDDWYSENQDLEKHHPEKMNKVLIFTKSRKLLEYVEALLQYEGWEVCRLAGNMDVQERQKNIVSFQNEPSKFIFLITTLTGGVGLNLVAANKVVVFDPNWNPAHDLQAIDRAFRIGQTRDVEVYRLLAAGCIEELIYKRQLYKQQMMAVAYEAGEQNRYFEAVQGVKDKEGELFGLRNLFGLSDTIDTKKRIEEAKLNQEVWAQEMDDKRSSDNADSKMIGLLTDSVEDVQKQLRKKLKNLGVSYSHSNAEVLKVVKRERGKGIPKPKAQGDTSWQAPKRPRTVASPKKLEADSKPSLLVLSD